MSPRLLILLVPLVVLQLYLQVTALRDLARQPRVAGNNKWLWVAIILLAVFWGHWSISHWAARRGSRSSHPLMVGLFNHMSGEELVLRFGRTVYGAALCRSLEAAVYAPPLRLW